VKSRSIPTFDGQGQLINYLFATRSFAGGILEVAATLLKRPKDELDGDDVQQYRKTRRLADLCKSLDEAQVLSDSSNHGSVYYFRSEFTQIAEQCKKVNYQTWH
jgi:hypothetical protein